MALWGAGGAAVSGCCEPEEGHKGALLWQEEKGTLSPGHFMHHYLGKWKVFMQITQGSPSSFSWQSTRASLKEFKRRAGTQDCCRYQSSLLRSWLQSLLKYIERNCTSLFSYSVAVPAAPAPHLQAFPGSIPAPAQPAQCCNVSAGVIWHHLSVSPRTSPVSRRPPWPHALKQKPNDIETEWQQGGKHCQGLWGSVFPMELESSNPHGTCCGKGGVRGFGVARWGCCQL